MLSALLTGLWRRAMGSFGVLQGVETHVEAARALEQSGDVAGARATYAAILDKFPEHAVAHHRVGSLYARDGEYEQALAHLKRAIAIDPTLAEAYLDLGNLCKLRKELDAAAAHYRHALRIEPRASAAHYNLGLLLTETGRSADALPHLAAAHEAADFPHALEDYALCLIELMHFEEAVAVLTAAIARQPGRAEHYFWLGMAYQEQHEPGEALRRYEHARQRGLATAEFFTRFGMVFHDLGRFEEALDHYDRALALRPGFPVAVFHRGLTRLLNGDYQNGWPDYEMRLASRDVPVRALRLPRWDGTALDGKSLLIYGEQGLGDQIMFASCLPDIFDRPGHCAVECAPQLEALFRRSFPAATVYPVSADGAVPPESRKLRIDAEIPIGSLPLHVRRDRAAFPYHNGYLKSDTRSVEAWRKRLALLGSGLKVGISWRGGTHKTRGPLRSLPLPQWLPILKCRHVQFVSLQYSSNAETDLTALEAESSIRVVHWREAVDDFEQTASLVSALDLVISVQTALVHLAGALGRPTWALVAAVPEWRYLHEGSSMPWYPAVRLFRQPTLHDWGSVVDRVEKELQRLSTLPALDQAVGG